jgi:hypothetical protein
MRRADRRTVSLENERYEIVTVNLASSMNLTLERAGSAHDMIAGLRDPARRPRPGLARLDPDRRRSRRPRRTPGPDAHPCRLHLLARAETGGTDDLLTLGSPPPLVSAGIFRPGTRSRAQAAGPGPVAGLARRLGGHSRGCRDCHWERLLLREMEAVPPAFYLGHSFVNIPQGTTLSVGGQRSRSSAE